MYQNNYNKNFYKLIKTKSKDLITMIFFDIPKIKFSR